MILALRRAVPVAVYGAAIGVIFYVDPLNMPGQVARSLLAGLVGAVALAAADRVLGEGRAAQVGRIVFGVVVCVLSFGDPLGVTNPFARCLLAGGAGFGAAFAVEMAVGASGFRRGSQALLLVTALTAADAHAQTCADPAPEPDAAWSAGYAMYIGRFCRGWRTDLEAMHEARALPGLDPACFDSQFAPGSAGATAFQAGGEAAEAARAAEPSFCTDPARSPPARAEVGTFIAPRP